MAKRQNEFHSIEELMNDFISENKLSKGLQKISVEEAWVKLMGQGVASYTQSVSLNGKTLVVRLNSSVLREELSYGKEKIIHMMNEELKSEIISKVLLT